MQPDPHGASPSPQNPVEAVDMALELDEGVDRKDRASIGAVAEIVLMTSPGG